MRSGLWKYGAAVCTAALLVASFAQCTLTLPPLVDDEEAGPDAKAEGGPDAAPACATAGTVTLVHGGLFQPSCVKVAASTVYAAGGDGTVTFLSKTGGPPCSPQPATPNTPIYDCAIDSLNFYEMVDVANTPNHGVWGRSLAVACTDASSIDYYQGQGLSSPRSVALPYAPGVAATVVFFTNPRLDNVQACDVATGGNDVNRCMTIAGYAGAGTAYGNDPEAGPAYRGVAFDSPYRIAADSDHIYWTNNGSGTIVSALFDGGEVTAIVTDAGAPMGIAVDPADGGYVYWGDQAGTIMRASKDGGGAAPVAPGVTPGAESLTLDTKYVYWVATGDGGPGTGAVLRAPLAGGCSTTLAAAQDNPWNLAVDPADGGSVYWVTNVNDGGIYQVVNPP